MDDWRIAHLKRLADVIPAHNKVRHGISIPDLASAIGTDRNVASAIISGRRTFTWAHAERFAKRHKVKPWWILAGDVLIQRFDSVEDFRALVSGPPSFLAALITAYSGARQANPTLKIKIDQKDSDPKPLPTSEILEARLALQFERLALLMPGQRETSHGVNTGEFATTVNVPSSVGSAVLLGKRYFTYAYAEAIALKHRISPAWIMGGDLLVDKFPSERELLHAVRDEHPINRHALISTYLRHREDQRQVEGARTSPAAAEPLAPQSICDLSLLGVSSDDLLRLQIRIAEELIHRQRAEVARPEKNSSRARVQFVSLNRRAIDR